MAFGENITGDELTKHRYTRSVRLFDRLGFSPFSGDISRLELESLYSPSRPRIPLVREPGTYIPVIFYQARR